MRERVGPGTAVPSARQSSSARAAEPSPPDTARAGILAGLPGRVEPALERMAGKLPDTVLFQLVTEMAPDDGGRWTQGRRLLFVGGNAKRLLGLSEDEIIADGRKVYAMMHPDDLKRFAAAEAHALAEARPLRLDVRMECPSGPRVFDVSAAPTPLPPTRPGGVRLLWDGAASDVTAAREDASERTRMTDIVEAADDLIAIVRPSGKVDYVNPAGRRMLGLGKDDPMPVPAALWEGGARGERMRHAIRTATREGLWHGEATLRRPDGSDLPVSQTLVAHRAAPLPGRRRGRVTHFSTIMRDATRAADTERALREAGERISIELRENAHRVKNLFALVPAIVSLSARTARDVDGFAGAVRERLAALARANAMTLGTGKVELSELARAVLEPYSAAERAVAIEGPPLAMLDAAATTIGLTLHELATNAVKYGALGTRGGRVLLSWTVDEGAVIAGTLRPVLSLEWRERDGPRIAPPNREGFGTSLVDRVIGAQGGSIERDWSAEGFTARIVLPTR